jgi:antitoxin ParD1/3/4
MTAMQKVSIALPADALSDVRAAVKTGDYASVDHVVRDALLWWEESNKTPEERLAWLRQAIQDGIDSGPAIEVDTMTFFEGVKRRGRERLASANKAA